jgi:hypothetical protein
MQKLYHAMGECQVPMIAVVQIKGMQNCFSGG